MVVKREPGVAVRSRSLIGKEHIIDELVDWLRNKELSVRQAEDLLGETKDFIEDAWRTEKEKVKL